MIILDKNGVLGDTIVEMTRSGHTPFTIQLKEGEYVQLLVPAGDRRTCVQLSVIGGKLEICGGSSIIDSIKGVGMAELVVDTEKVEEPDPRKTAIDDMTGFDQVDDETKRCLMLDGCVTAGKLADCTYDYVEAKYGPDFATRAKDWLKKLGVEGMRP